MGLTSKYLIPNVTPANLVSQDKTKNLYKMQNVSANNKISSWAYVLQGDSNTFVCILFTMAF